MSGVDRDVLGFGREAAIAFSFLGDLGYLKSEKSPNHVRFQCNGTQVNVYHGRQSYEISADVNYLGATYPVVSIIRAIDPDAAMRYRNTTATSQQMVVKALGELTGVVKKYCIDALKGNPEFFSALKANAVAWSEAYALEVLVGQVRPKAHDAFGQGNYDVAVSLYSQIRDHLTPVEAKKLAFAEKQIILRGVPKK
jgi:hypothetical protein